MFAVLLREIKPMKNWYVFCRSFLVQNSSVVLKFNWGSSTRDKSNLHSAHLQITDP